MVLLLSLRLCLKLLIYSLPRLTLQLRDKDVDCFTTSGMSMACQRSSKSTSLSLSCKVSRGRLQIRSLRQTVSSWSRCTPRPCHHHHHQHHLFLDALTMHVLFFQGLQTSWTLPGCTLCQGKWPALPSSHPYVSFRSWRGPKHRQ